VEQAEEMELVAKWNGSEYNVSIQPHQTVLDLKHKLEEMTKVQPKRQKLMGLGKGKMPPDDEVLSSLGLKSKHKFMMMGTVEEFILAEIPPDQLPEVINDLDYDYFPTGDDVAYLAENRARLISTIAKAEISVINPPRADKKLLVLDLDYTILDCKKMNDPGINLSDFRRPYLDEFLIACYKHYDIVIWSQTSWKWLEIKLTEMGMLTHPEYRISFVLDRSVMFTVSSTHLKTRKEHEVKALEIIWSKFPQYSKSNTIHVDDLSRNFAMNPKNGLKIVPFKNALETRRTDNILLTLASYLCRIALNEKDLSAIDHNNWENYSKS